MNKLDSKRQGVDSLAIGAVFVFCAVANAYLAAHPINDPCGVKTAIHLIAGSVALLLGSFRLVTAMRLLLSSPHGTASIPSDETK